MSWVFDLIFRPTFEILREKGDLDLIVATLPQTAMRDQAWSFIKAYIDRQLDEGVEEANCLG